MKRKLITLGLDIGYSGVKYVHAPSRGGHVTVGVFPARAAPASQISNNVVTNNNKDHVEVVVGDEVWIAGVDGSVISDSARELDENYISTKAYKALFYAALKKTNSSEIAKLVTGLPVSLCKTQASSLKESFTGSHVVDSTGRTVKVNDVVVLPQPLGSFFELTTGAFTEEDLQLSKVLVLDPGWFSFDFVVIDQNILRNAYSGMSTDAMSRVCEYAAELVSSQHDFPVAANKIEACLLQPRYEIGIRGQRVDVTEHIQSAANRAWDTVRREVGQKLRADRIPPDVVVISGGGARFFEAPIRDHFKKSKVHISDASILANATGFHTYAKKTLPAAVDTEKVPA